MTLPVPMGSKVLAIPELHTEIASNLLIYDYANCALVSRQWHDFWNPYVWCSIDKRNPQDQHCVRYGHLVRRFHAVLLAQGLRATAMVPISLDVVRQVCLELKTVTLISYTVPVEDFGRRIMDIVDFSAPSTEATGSNLSEMKRIGVPRAVPNGFLSNTIQSLTFTLPHDVGISALHWIVLAGRQGRLQGLQEFKLAGVNFRSHETALKVSANDIHACTVLFPDLREFSVSMSIGDPNLDQDTHSGGQSVLQKLKLYSLWSSTALPFILRPLHSLDSLTIGGESAETFLTQIPRHCPNLTRFTYLGPHDNIVPSLWIEFLTAYPGLTHLGLYDTSITDATVFFLARTCPSLQDVVLPRLETGITWQAVSALVENLAQLQVLIVTSRMVPGDFFGTRMDQEATSGGESEAVVVFKPWACQNTLQELVLRKVELKKGVDDYALFRQRMSSLKRLTKLSIFSELIAMECFVDTKAGAGQSSAPGFPCLEKLSLPSFEKPMTLTEVQAMVGQMPRLKEPGLTSHCLTREAEKWLWSQYRDTGDSDYVEDFE